MKLPRIITLASVAHIATPRHDEYGPALMAQARAALVARGLRYDNATGILRNNRDGELERLTDPRDHVPATSLEDVMRWQFLRYIGNSASRIARGLQP